MSPIIRKNITQLFVYRLRNQSDLLAVLAEMSAVYDNKTLMHLYVIDYVIGQYVIDYVLEYVLEYVINHVMYHVSD